MQWSRQETTSLGVTKGPQSTAKEVEGHTKAKRQYALVNSRHFSNDFSNTLEWATWRHELTTVVEGSISDIAEETALLVYGGMWVSKEKINLPREYSTAVIWLKYRRSFKGTHVRQRSILEHLICLESKIRTSQHQKYYGPITNFQHANWTLLYTVLDSAHFPLCYNR